MESLAQECPLDSCVSSRARRLSSLNDLTTNIMATSAGISHHNVEDEKLRQTETNISRVMSSGAVTISPELFEKLYLTPKTPHTGDNLKRFANPTPLGFVGFVISTMSFAMVSMGWGGANGLAGVA